MDSIEAEMTWGKCYAEPQPEDDRPKQIPAVIGTLPKKNGGFKKIKEHIKGNICRNPEHNPPAHIVLEPGVYEYECPECSNITIVNVPYRSMSAHDGRTEHNSGA